MLDAFESTIDDPILVDMLNSSLDYADDVAVTVTYSYEGSLFGLKLGRSINDYRAIYEGLLSAASNSTNRDTEINTPLHVGKVIRTLIDPFSNRTGIKNIIESGPLSKLPSVLSETMLNEVKIQDGVNNQQSTEAVYDKISRSGTDTQDYSVLLSNCVFHLDRKQFTKEDTNRFGQCVYENLLTESVQIVRIAMQRTTYLDSFLEDRGFFEIASLINNQPQLLLTGGARFRDELAGGDVMSAKLSFEFDMTGHNVNNMLRSLKDPRQADKIGGGCISNVGTEYMYVLALECSEEIGHYVSENSINNGAWRGSVSIEYEDHQSGPFSVPSVSDPLNFGGGSTLIGSVAVGRQFQILKSSLPQAKLDFSLSYEDVSDDPARQNRALGTITFTQKIADSLNLSLGLLWANKPEFLPNADSEIGARIGLNYKLSDN